MTKRDKYFTKIFFFSKFLPFQQIWWAIFVENMVSVKPTPQVRFGYSISCSDNSSTLS